MVTAGTRASASFEPGSLLRTQVLVSPTNSAIYPIPPTDRQYLHNLRGCRVQPPQGRAEPWSQANYVGPPPQLHRALTSRANRDHRRPQQASRITQTTRGVESKYGPYENLLLDMMSATGLRPLTASKTIIEKDEHWTFYIEKEDGRSTTTSWWNRQ